VPVRTRPDAAVRRLVENLHFELVPMASIDAAIDELPPGAAVSVTCSPTKGIATTQELVVRLLDLGHRPIPHLAARLVEDREHATKLAIWLREYGIREVFVIAGDAPVAAGPYEGAVPFLRDLLDAEPCVERIGVAGYPEGHPSIPPAVAAEQLRIKRDLLAEAGVDGWVSTQMCFDTTAIVRWLSALRDDGVVLPVRLGVPGVVERSRLLAIGARVGVGASLRYLGKNRAAVWRLLVRRGFDLTDFVTTVARRTDRLGVDGLHSFTFNAVAATHEWQQSLLSAGARSPR
jgi:methylenetetrahydrofolate reductase (NADPH)